MTVQNKVRKGDVVALAVTRSVTYAFGSGRGHEVSTHYTLAIVNGATRDGEARSLRRVGGSIIEMRRKDFTLNQVMTIGGANQAKALAAFKALRWDADQFDTVDALRETIVSRH